MFIINSDITNEEKILLKSLSCESKDECLSILIQLHRVSEDNSEFRDLLAGLIEKLFNSD